METECGKQCPWYYRASGAWCPTHKKLYKPDSEEYFELTFVERK